MLGFEVHFKERVISAALEEGSLHLIAATVRNKADIVVTGSDLRTEEHVYWCMEELKLGDTVTLKVAEIEKISEPKKPDPPLSEEKILEGKLHSYNRLKKELEEQGVI